MGKKWGIWSSHFQEILRLEGNLCILRGKLIPFRVIFLSFFKEKCLKNGTNFTFLTEIWIIFLRNHAFFQPCFSVTSHYSLWNILYCHFAIFCMYRFPTMAFYRKLASDNVCCVFVQQQIKHFGMFFTIQFIMQCCITIQFIMQCCNSDFNVLQNL